MKTYPFAYLSILRQLQFHIFLSLAVDGGECTSLRPGPFILKIESFGNYLVLSTIPKFSCWTDEKNDKPEARESVYEFQQQKTWHCGILAQSENCGATSAGRFYAAVRVQQERNVFSAQSVSISAHAPTDIIPRLSNYNIAAEEWSYLCPSSWGYLMSCFGAWG